MDIIESIKKDKSYLKCKLIVKTWEKEFKNKHSRTPSKLDIKEAASNIKYAYKKYFQLKSALLENSLSSCDFEDDTFESPVNSPTLENLSPEPFSTPHETIPDLPSGIELDQLLSNSQSMKSKACNVNPSVDNLSQKLFQNRKFSIRNPRKLSSLKSQSIVEEKIENNRTNKTARLENSDQNELSEKLDINQTIPINDSLKLKTYSIAENLCTLKTTPLRRVNVDWIQRAVPACREIDNNYEKNINFGISNIVLPELNDAKIPNNIDNTVTPEIEKVYDYVENSESDEDNEYSKLKPALKKRKIDEEHLSSVANKQSSSVTKKIKKKNKTQNIIKPIKDKDHQPPDILEYVPFGVEKDINPRHHNVLDLLNNIKSNTLPVNQSTVEINETKIMEKMKNGTLNDNFIKINIEKKVFVRGKKGRSYSNFKKQQWKDKKALNAGMEFPEQGKISCFKCGQGGHMARYCTAHKGDTLLPLDSYDENNLPTLDDMQLLVSKEASMSDEKVLSQSLSASSQIPDSFLKLLSDSTSNNVSDVKPIYSDSINETPNELNEVLQMFGHDTFRPGQKDAIIRILRGKSTLLILSTGGGKSLCYQIPAYIYSKHYKCITLVISPLVSLMEDQVLSMPDFLKAGCLHTNQPPTQRKKIVQCLKDGEINILLISPEALISGDNSNGFGSLFKSLPKIAFACIDEAHCVSQWSHNFRPSYLMICRVLREKLNVNCILGLTATASQPTIQSVISHINIPDGINGVITNPTLPDNLSLSVSLEEDKDKALISYLVSDRIVHFNSIIVYCIRRDECERIAAILRSFLQERNKINMEKDNKKRKRMSYVAEAYHAGMSAAQRKKIQRHFMDGTLRIIVATVAFGMGINKANIRCIIHYNMPSSFESYVQEVGRAGRDGEKAYCHVFISKINNDKNELLKHIHSNTIDRPTVRRLLQRLFIPCECNTVGSTENMPSSSKSESIVLCKGHEVGIPIERTVEELDLASENIATLLCYIELHPKHYIKLQNNAYIMCKISSYGGPQKILEAAKSCAPLAMAYLLESKRDKNIVKNNILEFNVIEVAAAIGWESGITKYHLKNLEWITENGSTKRSLLKVEFNTLGFRIKAPGNLCPAELDDILDDLHGSVLHQEKTRLFQLEEINVAFRKLGNYSLEINDISEESLLYQSDELKKTIRNYFQRNNAIPDSISLEKRPIDIDRVRSDVQALISIYKDCDFTGRSIARIFQGISSPNYPAQVWGRCKFWRAHIHEDFYGLVKVATEQILRIKL